MYIISRCLLGFNCKYDGGNNRNDDIVEFFRTHDCVTVCPETAAGLESPRTPSEITGVRVTEDGKDVFTVTSKTGDDMKAPQIRHRRWGKKNELIYEEGENPENE